MSSNTIDKVVLYVGGLDDTVDEKILHAAFIPFGEVKTIELPKDFTTQRHKGFGFLEFEDYDDCLHAIDNMNNAELCGRVLRVTFAKPQKFKEGSQKPIWTEEEYHKTFLNLDTNKQENKKKLFA